MPCSISALRGANILRILPVTVKDIKEQKKETENNKRKGEENVGCARSRAEGSYGDYVRGRKTRERDEDSMRKKMKEIFRLINPGQC